MMRMMRLMMMLTMTMMMMMMTNGASSWCLFASSSMELSKSKFGYHTIIILNLSKCYRFRRAPLLGRLDQRGYFLLLVVWS